MVYSSALPPHCRRKKASPRCSVHRGLAAQARDVLAA